MINDLFQLPQGSDPCRITGACAGVPGTAPTRPALVPIPSAGAIIGHLDSVSVSKGKALASGWACAEGSVASVDIHLYAGGPYGTGSFIGYGRADRASEQAVAAVCGTSGARYRFSIPISAWDRVLWGGHPLFAYGVYAGSPTGLLWNSGNLPIP